MVPSVRPIPVKLSWNWPGDTCCFQVSGVLYPSFSNACDSSVPPKSSKPHRILIITSLLRIPTSFVFQV
ncbi:MAG: hypothetical protein WCI71_03375, partial [Bacteroidota bacterium]